MAEAACGLAATALQQFTGAISEEIRRGSLEDQLISGLKNDLEQMMAFLRVADSKELETRHQQLVKQVRELSNRIEDHLHTYVCRCTYCRRKRSSKLHKFYASIKNMLCCTQSELHILKSESSEVCDRCKSYTEDHPIDVTPTWYDCRLDVPLVQEDQLVGMDRPKRELKELISNWQSQSFKVICVVGMGGSGKTTLVKSVYDDAGVEKMFRHHIWITVSQSRRVGDVNNLLQDIIGKLPIGQKQPPAMNDTELKNMLYEFLQGKNYILVLDDIWKDAVWDSIKCAFPQNRFSRIVITTRSRDIAGDSAYFYEMKPLPREESRTLFCKKAFPESLTCHPDLKEISESILDRCEGLPLGIALIGGVLSAKGKVHGLRGMVYNIDEWERFSRSLGAELVAGGPNNKLMSITNILSLSYYDLPHHLQKCYLYLSIFPEDYFIEKMRLIRLWMAEGFVEERTGLTLEEVTEDYLNELIRRSLIQVATRTIDDRIETCRIHDHLRELLLSKSKEQNFVTIVRERELQQCRDNDEVRRLAIYSSINDETVQSCEFSRLRSLQMMRAVEFPYVKSILRQSRGGFNLLKVLYLRGEQLDKIPDEVFTLLHLKYLSLRDSNVRTIPNSIGRLQELETLDLKNTMVTKLPVQILRLKKLRHLLIYRYEILVDTFYVDTFGFEASYNIGCLVNMQKLSCIEAGEVGGIKVVNEIGKLTQLRRLGITKLKNGDGAELCSCLEKLSKLRSLSINSVDEMEAIDLSSSMSSFPKYLRNLSLRGHLLSIPPWVSSLRFLVRVYLRRSKLSNNLLLPPLQDSGNNWSLCHIRHINIRDSDH